MKTTALLLAITGLCTIAAAAPLPAKSTNPIRAFALTTQGAKNFGTDYSSPEGQVAKARFEEWKETSEGQAELAQWNILFEGGILVSGNAPVSKIPMESKTLSSGSEDIVEQEQPVKEVVVEASSVPAAEDVKVPKQVATGASVEPLKQVKAVVKPSKGMNNSTGYRNVAYYGNWFSYKGHSPSDIPSIETITHLLYAFVKVEPNGSVVMGDPYADENQQGNNVNGNIKQLYLLKQQHRNLKVMLSIGGWTYSENGEFSRATSTAEKRATFVSTAIDFVQQWALDGLDIDWEYPTNEQDAKNYVHLLRELRRGLDAYSQEHADGYHFEITIASAAGPKKYGIMHMKEMSKYLDAFNLMAYDYAGSWDTVTGHQANLYPDVDNTDTTPFSTDRAVQDYIKAGVPAIKIVLGMGTYGRFLKTAGPGSKFTKADKETYDYKDLPKPGAVEFFDETLVASGSYDPKTREFISYDTPKAVEKKVEYIKENHLGGAMFWETSGDRSDDESLIGLSAKSLGSIARSKNLLDYPASRFDNIRSGMKDE